MPIPNSEGWWKLVESNGEIYELEVYKLEALGGSMRLAKRLRHYFKSY